MTTEAQPTETPPSEPGSPPDEAVRESATPPSAPFSLTHRVRLVTATSLFDGHDASINIMRRIAQSCGAEVIHLGHNRSVAEMVDAAIAEDAQGVAVTSYQGGHMEYFKYVHDLLAERGCGHIRIFGGGGGVILPHEIAELHEYGIGRIYSPDDGREMGLKGMVQDMLARCDFANGGDVTVPALATDDPRAIAVAISECERDSKVLGPALNEALAQRKRPPVVGITGTGGAGKSSLIDELVRRFLSDLPEKTLAVLSVDPSRRKTGGALLGDRIRMNAVAAHPRVYMRSLATRQANLALAGCIREALDVLAVAGFDLIVLETSGIGQSDTEIVDFSDVALYVMTPEYGAASQLEKIDMLDFADLVAINKFDRRGAKDALRDVKKQWRRNHEDFESDAADVPVFGTMASQFNDRGTNALYKALIAKVAERTGADLRSTSELRTGLPDLDWVIPPRRVRYLAEIVENNREYDAWARGQAALARRLFQLDGAIAELRGRDADVTELLAARDALDEELDPDCRKALDEWPELVEMYSAEHFTFRVRNREIRER